MSNHAVFQILATTPAGMEAGTGWFSADANALAKKKYPDLARDAVYAFTNAHVVLGSTALFLVPCTLLAVLLTRRRVLGD